MEKGQLLLYRNSFAQSVTFCCTASTKARQLIHQNSKYGVIRKWHGFPNYYHNNKMRNMIQMPEISRNVKDEAREPFRWGPAIVLMVLLLTFVGANVYILFTSF